MRLPAWALTLACLSIVSGCGGGEHEDVKQWMVESSRDMKGRVSPLPELKPFPIVSYEGAQASYPFSDVRLEPEKKEGVGDNSPDFNRPREQLESFPVESLQFIGVINKTQGGARHALIKVDGVIYQATKGNFIGQNFGRISNVTDAEVVFTETVLDPSGQTSNWIERQASLQLQEGLQSKESGK